MNRTELFDYIKERGKALNATSKNRLYEMRDAEEFADHTMRDAFQHFMRDVYSKAREARDKYNFSELGWATPDWQEELQRGIAEHVQKGDPRDVAVYAMFAWFHGWSTATPVLPSTVEAGPAADDEAATSLRNEADEYAAKQGILPDGSLIFTRVAEAYEAGARSRSLSSLEGRAAPASDEVLATVQIDIPGDVATVSFEEADMYGGLTAWLRAKGYIGKNEDGEDETEDNITHWAGPNVSRAHYATLTENTALLARVRQAEAKLAAPSVVEEGGVGFQPRVAKWMQETFGPEVSADFTERGFRFGEEAIELLQANGTSKADVLKLVDYVYDRPVGELAQEVGGTLVTLAALCQARGIDLLGAANAEQARVEQPAVRARIQQKQADKRARMIATPLPGTAPTPTVEGTQPHA